MSRSVDTLNPGAAGSSSPAEAESQALLTIIKEKGQEFVEFREGKGLKGVSIDVYCGETKAQTIELARGKGDVFRGGPIALCANSAEQRFKALIIREESTITGAQIRQGMTERPEDEPLAVNTDPKHFFSLKTKEAGEMDLRDLAKKPALFEEGFLFVSGKDKKGKPLSFWYERGEKETPSEVVISLDSVFVGAVLTDFSSVTEMGKYHIHPRSENVSDFGRRTPSLTDYTTFVDRVLDGSEAGIGIPVGVCSDNVITAEGVFRMKADVTLIEANPAVAYKAIAAVKISYNAFKRGIEGAFGDLTVEMRNRLFAHAISTPYVSVVFDRIQRIWEKKLSTEQGDVAFSVPALALEKKSSEAASHSLDFGGVTLSDIQRNVSLANHPRKEMAQRPPTDSLVANLSLPHYFSYRTQAEGEADLVALAGKKGEKKDLFVYIAGKTVDDGNRAYWYEIGSEEGPAGAKINVDNVFFRNLQSDFESLSEFSIYRFGSCAASDAGYLSPEDFEEFVNGFGSLDSRFRHNRFPSKRYAESVVTSAGIWRIELADPNHSLTFEGQQYSEFFQAPNATWRVDEHVPTPRSNLFDKLKKDLFEGVRKMAKELPLLLEGPLASLVSPDERRRRYAKALSQGGIRITFRPMPLKESKPADTAPGL